MSRPTYPTAMSWHGTHKSWQKDAVLQYWDTRPKIPTLTPTHSQLAPYRSAELATPGTEMLPAGRGCMWGQPTLIALPHCLRFPAPWHIAASVKVSASDCSVVEM